MIGNIYKLRLKRVKVLEWYNRNSLTCLIWGANEKSVKTILKLDRIKNLKQIV